MAISNVYNRDCLEAMKEFPDKFFNLAIVDPPYGIGIDKAINANKGKQGYKMYRETDWDNAIPPEQYFIELKRVSKNQIIWGGNYFTDFLGPKMGWIVWNKMQREFTLADGELAWTSYNNALRIFDMSRGEALAKNNKEGGRIHPTQKPVKLYEWLLKNYAKEGDRILDTHLGSGSSRIACHDMGFDFWGYELDKDYFDAMEKRFQNHIKQPSLFAPEEMYHQSEIK